MRIFEVVNGQGEGLVISEADELAEFCVKLGDRRQSALLRPDDARAVARALLKRFDSPAPRLRAIDGGAR